MPHAVAGPGRNPNVPGQKRGTIIWGHGSILCMVPAGVHCDDPLSCNPGDTQTTIDDIGWTNLYRAHLCGQVVLCKSAADAGVHAAVCTGIWSNGTAAGSPNASADGGDAGSMHCCGDGLIDPGEECDFGDLNDVPVDTSSGFLIPNASGIVWCDSTCQNPHPLCVPTDRLGGIFCD